MEEKFCTGCGRRCSLDAPHCEVGREYAKNVNDRAECDEIVVDPDRARVLAEERKQRYKAMDINNKLICNIRDMCHTVRALSDGKASQKRILIILNECGEITQSELTERLCVKPGTASEVIGKLERAELITRTENEKDKRTCALKLTEEGVNKAVEVAAERKTRYGEMFGCLNDEEKNAFLALLEKVTDDWQTRYGDKKSCADCDNEDPKHDRHKHGRHCEGCEDHGRDRGHHHDHGHGHKHGKHSEDK